MIAYAHAINPHEEEPQAQPPYYQCAAGVLAAFLYFPPFFSAFKAALASLTLSPPLALPNRTSCPIGDAQKDFIWIRCTASRYWKDTSIQARHRHSSDVRVHMP